MSVAIIDSFENENPISDTLKHLLQKEVEEFSYFKVKDMNILPCRSCGACAFKSPGRCVLNDDVHEIMKSIARSSMVIFLTPVRFGGYSSQLKKVVDRIMPMGLPLYFVKDGKMLHPMRYGHKFLIGIGVVEENIQNQEENFKSLVASNAFNMQFTHETFIFKPSDDINKFKGDIENVLRKVN